MMRKDLEALLAELKFGLSSLYGDRLISVLLYGSYVRNEQDPESDLDVLIVLDDFVLYSDEIRRSGGIISELSLKYGTSISRTFIRENRWRTYDSPLLRNVRAEAIQL